MGARDFGFLATQNTLKQLLLSGGWVGVHHMSQKIHACIVQNIPLSLELSSKKKSKTPFALINSFNILVNSLLESELIELSIICSSPLSDVDVNMIKEPFQHKNVRTIRVIPNLSTYSLKDNLRFTLRSIPLLQEIHERHPIDVIHTRYPFSSILAAIFARKLGLKGNPKIIYDIRNPWVDSIFEMKRVSGKHAAILRKIIHWVERYSLYCSDGFIFMNDALKEYYMSKFGKFTEEKSVLCLNGEFEENRFGSSLGTLESYWKEFNSDVPTRNEDHQQNSSSLYLVTDEERWKRRPIRLGYVGSMEKWRNLDFLVTMMRDVIKEFPRAHLVFIGSGAHLGELKELTTELALDEHVFFLGAKQVEELPYYYQTFDVGLSHLPKSLTGWLATPLKVLEYLYFNVPVLASNVPAHSRLRDEFDGQGVYLYDFTKASFVNALRIVLTSQLRHPITTRDLVNQRFGRQFMMKSHEHLYQNCINEVERKKAAIERILIMRQQQEELLFSDLKAVENKFHLINYMRQ